MEARDLAVVEAEATKEVIARVCDLVHKKTGIQLGDKQHSMVESRLRRRIMDLGLESFREYSERLEDHEAAEIEPLVSLITTHHTYFFREFSQFEYLEKILPTLVSDVLRRGEKELQVLSSACSRGQEVYSLAMFLKHHLALLPEKVGFRIMGTDVDQESVGIAGNGVYRRDEIKEVPALYLADHWAKGTGDIAEFVKAKKSIREACHFTQMNLLDLKPIATKKFDVIFCRNVFIYFTPAQIKDITAKLTSHVHDTGYFFVGVSESLHGLNLPLQAVGPSVYRKPQAKAMASAPAATKTTTVGKAPATPAAPAPAAAAFEMPNPLRVLCVDDSASILTLLKKVLQKEHGFEVVGTAANGAEAAEKVKELKPHLITLDIHMPVQTGIEYLQKNFGPSHPPVVMITSVARESTNLAIQALQYGASDYVEKPALNNLEQRSEEIRIKLKSAFRAKAMKVNTSHKLDKQFSKSEKLKRPENKARLLVLSVGDFAKAKHVLAEMKGDNVPTFLGLEGAGNLVPDLAAKLAKESGLPVLPYTKENQAKGPFLLGDLADVLPLFKAAGSECKSMLVLGEVSKQGAKQMLENSSANLVLEDLGGGKGTAPLHGVAREIVPFTSFPIVSSQYFLQSEAVKK